MKSNVDYTICPECSSLNSAMWFPLASRSYSVGCQVCGYEFEHGHYDSNDIVLLFDETTGAPADWLPMTDEQIGQILLIGAIADAGQSGVDGNVGDVGECDDDSAAAADDGISLKKWLWREV